MHDLVLMVNTVNISPEQHLWLEGRAHATAEVLPKVNVIIPRY